MLFISPNIYDLIDKVFSRRLLLTPVRSSVLLNEMYHSLSDGNNPEITHFPFLTTNYKGGSII